MPVSSAAKISGGAGWRGSRRLLQGRGRGGSVRRPPGWSCPGDAPDAQLGALQVHEDADRATGFALDLADLRIALGVITVAAVAEVEAEHICTRADQLADAFDRSAGWTQRGEYSRAAIAFHAASAPLNSAPMPARATSASSPALTPRRRPHRSRRRRRRSARRLRAARWHCQCRDAAIVDHVLEDLAGLAAEHAGAGLLGATWALISGAPSMRCSHSE